jgi:hypothetical protein
MIIRSPRVWPGKFVLVAPKEFCNTIPTRADIHCSVLARRARADIAPLFDHLVGTADQRQRHCYADDLGGLQVDNQLDAARLLYR